MSNVTDFEINNGVLAKYKGSDSDVVIPIGVTKIGRGAFDCCKSMESITVPDSVTEIEGSAFGDCSNLKSVTILGCISSIQSYTFANCSSLRSIKIPNSVTIIGLEAFRGCKSLENIVLPDSLRTIQNGAFEGCSNLTDITIPNNVIAIGARSFKDCGKFEEVIIPDSVTQFGENLPGDYTFQKGTIVILKNYFKGLAKSNVSDRVVIRETPIQEIKSTNDKLLAVTGFLTVNDLSVYSDDVVESYKKYLKGKVVNYTYIVLENDTEMIVRRLSSLGLLDKKFVDKLQENDLTNEVKSILSENSSKIQKKSKTSTSQSKGPSVAELKKVWSYKKNEEGVTITSYKGGDTDVVIPEMIGRDAVTEIGDDALSPGKRGINEFQEEVRKRITSITIPETIRTIGQGAFARCINLSDITIPSSVKTIDSDAFSGCNNLVNVTIPDSVVSMGERVFFGCNKLPSITIPDSVMELYYGTFSGCYDKAVYVHRGSYAEEFANKCNISVHVID